MPSARCSMLERAPQDDRATEARSVAFRGAGFVPKAGRTSGWIALALVIALRVVGLPLDAGLHPVVGGPLILEKSGDQLRVRIESRVETAALARGFSVQM